jgi:hypothetical protein
MIAEFIDYLKTHQQAVNKCCYGGLIAIILWSMIAVDTQHVHTWLEKIPGFWSIFALISCVVLIFVARWLAKGGLTTREDYYDN